MTIKIAIALSIFSTYIYFIILSLFLSLFYSALCFFKIPGVGFALLQALPVSKSHIKRILKETAGDEDTR
jgi:hypothetical protein